MPEPTLAAAIAQFGIAGLIGWMWLAERRTAAIRDRQLAEAHDRLDHDRVTLAALLAALDRNTHALATLEAGQRRLADILDRPFPPAPTTPPIPPRRPAPRRPSPEGERHPAA